MRFAAVVTFACALALGCVPAHAIGVPAGTRLEIVAHGAYLDSQLGAMAACPASVALTVVQVAGVQIEKAGPVSQPLPSQVVYLPLRVRNTGNGIDTFDLLIASALGWPVTLVYDDNADGVHQSSEEWTITTTGMMVADGYCPCFAKVAIPAGATASDTITVCASSTLDPVGGRSEIELPLDAPGRPEVTITMPTVDPAIAISSNTITLEGIASGEATIDSVAWQSDRGGGGVCAGTTSWTAPNIALQPGTNIITVTATDSVRRSASDALMVVCASGSSPAIAIVDPTNDPTYTTNATALTVSGSASDAAGIQEVTWTNDCGGSGTCAGTTTWSASDIELTPGENTITVTARNSVGNTASDVLTVICEEGPPATAEVEITFPTSAPSYSTNSSSVTLAGTVSGDPDIAEVRWSSSRGVSGRCAGTRCWNAVGVPLWQGDNVITVTARDTASNTFWDSITVVCIVPNPTLRITSPTYADTYRTTQPSVSISGTASAAGGITEVTWANERGGSGVCTGTICWSAADIALYDGDNPITVTAHGASGPVGFDCVTVVYGADTSPPVIEITSPTSEPRCVRNCALLRIAGHASDDFGVADIAWSNAATGGTGFCQLDGEYWSASDIQLLEGENVIVVAAEDTAGNLVAVGLTVTYIFAEPGEAWVGRAMVSLPIIPDEIDPKLAVDFYANSWCTYVTNLNRYVLYPHQSTWFQPASATPGRGFWALFADQAAAPCGMIPPQDQPAVIQLRAGWNLIGTPFISEVLWDTSRIMIQETGQAPEPLRGAFHLTSGYLWGWRQDPNEPGTGNYYLVYDPDLVPGVDDRIEPWRAYWMEAERDCLLILPPPESAL